MKRTKRAIALGVFVVVILFFAACDRSAEESGYTVGNIFTVDDIQDNPADFAGTITLIGVVGHSVSHDFLLRNEAGTFVVQIDYRGNQALPQVGDRVSVEGRLAEMRACCGPGFEVVSMRFEEAGN
ncbi:MAG: hypothetical protein FWC95_05980 [Defluviitaleaceae bacterium]|nr:hypothetical protein [Defluviitaleaceae bacterium]